nr:MAG TPA: hypothetical protein [Caudoviricetes sp.]
MFNSGLAVCWPSFLWYNLYDALESKKVLL